MDNMKPLVLTPVRAAETIANIITPNNPILIIILQTIPILGFIIHKLIPRTSDASVFQDFPSIDIDYLCMMTVFPNMWVNNSFPINPFWLVIHSLIHHIIIHSNHEAFFLLL